MMTEQQREALAGNAANARIRYLLAHNPNAYAEMHDRGELKEHLDLIGKEAADHYDTLVTQMRDGARERGETPNEAQISASAWELTLADIVNV
jgi:hypothetical protein